MKNGGTKKRRPKGVAAAKPVTGTRSVTEEDKAIGQRLRAMRLDRDVSQDALAKQLGISFQQIQKYEKGLNRVAMARAKEICAFLDFPITQLFAASSKDSDGEFDTQSYKLAKSFNNLRPNVKLAIRRLIDTLVSEDPQTA